MSVLKKLVPILVIFGFGCSTPNARIEENSNREISKHIKKEYPFIVKLDKNTKIVDENLSSICDILLYIPLETNSLSLLSSFRGAEIIVAENEIFFFLAEGIYVFTNSGKFVRQIGKRGNGPGEYNFIDGGMTNSTNDTIICNDLLGNKINVYSKTGSFIKKLPFTNSLRIFGWKNSIILDNRSPDEPLFSIISLNGDIRYKSQRTYSKELQKIVLKDNQIFSSINDNRFLFRYPYSDTVYIVNNSLKISPAYIFDLGNYKFPYSSQIKNGDIDQIFNNSIFLGNFFELNESALFYVRYFGKSMFGLFNLENSETIILENGFSNDLDSGPSFYPRFFSKDQKYLVTYIDAVELKAHVASDKFNNSTPKYPEKKKELEKLANSLDENDNPVLMLLKLKE